MRTTVKGIFVRRSRFVGAAAAAVLLVPIVQVVPASAAGAAGPSLAATPNDFRQLTRKDFTLDGHKVVTPERYQPKAQQRLRAAATTPPVGSVRQWLGLDDTTGQLYRKDYTLRGVGEKIEVW